MDTCYLLRSKGRALVMRAGGLKTDPVYPVTPGEWTPFEHLPMGIGPEGDADVIVKEVSAAEFKKFKKPKSVAELRAERMKLDRDGVPAHKWERDDKGRLRLVFSGTLTPGEKAKFTALIKELKANEKKAGARSRRVARTTAASTAAE